MGYSEEGGGTLLKRFLVFALGLLALVIAVAAVKQGDVTAGLTLTALSTVLIRGPAILALSVLGVAWAFHYYSNVTTKSASVTARPKVYMRTGAALRRHLRPALIAAFGFGIVAFLNNAFAGTAMVTPKTLTALTVITTVGLMAAFVSRGDTFLGPAVRVHARPFSGGASMATEAYGTVSQASSKHMRSTEKVFNFAIEAVSPFTPQVRDPALAKT
jgi:hypothetical protein